MHTPAATIHNNSLCAYCVRAYRRTSLCICTSCTPAASNSSKNTHTHNTAWRRPIGCLRLYRSFPTNSPISGSFAKNDLQLKATYASSPPCTHPLEQQRHTQTYIYTHMYIYMYASCLQQHTHVLKCLCIFIHVYICTCSEHILIMQQQAPQQH